MIEIVHYLRRQNCSGMTQLETIEIAFVGVVLSLSTSTAVQDALNHGPNESIVALWSIAPGLVGGLAMQLIPEKLKPHRQLFGELMLSGIAGFIVGALCHESIDSNLRLGALTCVAGASGSALIYLLVKTLEARFGKVLEGMLGEVPKKRTPDEE